MTTDPNQIDFGKDEGDALDELAAGAPGSPAKSERNASCTY